MRERPILFSAPMVRAILAGTKTQTRRVVKWKPREDGLNLSFSGLEAGFYCSNLERSGWVLRSRGAGGCWNDRTYPLRCPYGAPGDRLWVKETWRSSSGADAKSPTMLAGHGWPIWYAADDAVRWTGASTGGPGFTTPGKTRVSIHMPRWASRITLEVTCVRVERLHAITEEDARVEGVEPFVHPSGMTSYRDGFARLWSEINGTFDENVWVWVVEFKRIDAAERAA